MKQILVADDEEVLRMLITDTLEDEGYQITEAEDGDHAYELMINNDFDLVILDYMMPGRTGVDVAKEMSDNYKENTPLLMLTAKTQGTDVEQSIEAGIHYFMGKPFSPIELAMFVEEILS
ncbi:response regulator transcription factor [Halobacillus seohaensis]|uniref:Response regulator transcription factor n=1 Tax=Halobacillus seohaensis TaxID=447421 RepID=A0ABW2EP33_9BACI